MSDPTTVEKYSLLGDVALLAELYDASTKKFFGVQLYTQESMGLDGVKIVTARDPSDTHLSLSSSNTFQTKKDVLDVSAELSLQILAGTVDVSGSASYLKDTESNTSQECWAMKLHYLGREERIDVGNTKLVPLSNNLKGFYASATHYVSAIRYGGDVVVSLVEETNNLTADEKIEGKLKAELSELAGKVSLTGDFDAKVVSNYTYLDKKFNVQIYGDISISKIPTDAKDVLEVFSDALSGLGKGGVPVTVTLQPIPTTLRAAVKIHSLDANIVNALLTAYGQMDDLSNRFEVLADNAKRNAAYIPYLADAIDAAYTTFLSDHTAVTILLKQFLIDFQASQTSDTTTILAAVKAIRKKNRSKPNDNSIKPPLYPKSQEGLEKAFANFALLSYTVSLHKLDLTSLSNLSTAPSRHPSFLLFLSWSVSSTSIAIFQSLIDKGYGLYGVVLPCYFVYVEDTREIGDELVPRGSSIDTTDTYKVSLLRYEIKGKSITWPKISWNDLATQALSPPDQTPDSQRTSKLYGCDLNFFAFDVTKDSGYSYGLLYLSDYSPPKSFTIIVKAVATALSNPSVLVSVGYQAPSQPQFVLQVSDDHKTDVFVYIPDANDSNKQKYHSIAQGSSLTVNPYSNFEIAFVQDSSAKKWIIYVNGARGASWAFPSGFTWMDADKSLIAGAASKPAWPTMDKDGKDKKWNNWNGTVHIFRAYPSALSEPDIKDIYNKTK